MSRRVPWVALAWAGLGLVGLMGLRLLRAGFLPPPCPFKALTGLPCATCGATRSVQALAEGHVGLALHWHPVLVLGLLLSPAAVIWDLRRALRAEPYPALPEAPIWRLAAAGLLLGSWACQILRGI